MEQLIKSCIVVFEKVARSVPSNHYAEIMAEVEKLKKELEKLDGKNGNNKPEHTR